MTPAVFAVVSSIFTLGGLVGALSAGPLSTRRGRLYPLRLTAPFFIAGSLLEALAPSVPFLIIGRILSGVGAGASITVGPIYIAEIAPTQSRGLLGAATQVVINLGIIITLVLGWLFGYGAMWRLVLGVGAVLGVLQLATLAFAVESPEWLGANGRPGDARRNLLKIRGGKLGPDEAGKWASLGEADEEDAFPPPCTLRSYNTFSTAELTHPKDEQQSLLSPKPTDAAPNASSRVGMLDALRSPVHRPAVVAVVSVMLAQQLCGINSVIMYSTSFLSALLPTGAALVTVGVGVLNLAATAAFAPLPDRIGRVPCLLLSIAGMGTGSVALAFAVPAGATVPAAVATLFFAASFALGLGPVPFILASELAGPGAVGATQSWALGANWCATFLVAQLFPVFHNLWGGRTFFVFAGLALGFGAFVAWSVPESKGKKDADEVWGRDATGRRED